MNTFDEKVKISIGLAVVAIGGGAVWLTNLSSQTYANTKSLESIEQRQLKYNESIQNIEKDMAIVRTKLDLLILSQ